MRGLVAIACAVVVGGSDVAVQTDGTLELLEPKLGGVALQLRELEAMRERGTLTDTTFKHAVHETTVLGPLTASLAAMGVLHDKGQLSDEELALAKSVAFSRYERGADGQVLLPGSANPSPTPEATVTLKTSDDKEREGEAKAAQRRAATKLAMEAAEEKARTAEAALAAEKERKARERDAERAAAAEAKRAKKEAEAAAFEAAAREAEAAADAAADAETAAAARRAEAADAEASARRAEADRVEEAEKIAAEAQAYADEATAAGNAEAAAEAETIAAEARAAVAEARAAAEAAEVSAREKEAYRKEEEAEAARLATKAAEEKAATEAAAAKDDASPEESIVLDTTPAAEPAEDAAAAAFMAAAAAEKAYFDETTKKEAADVAAATAREKAATEPLAKARKAARGAQCEGWHQTGRCTPEGPREAHSDRTCDDDVPAGASGYCECGDHGRAAKSDCDHASFRCQTMCAARQAALLDDDVCQGWRQTGGCTPHGPREAGSDKTCDEEVPAGSSGYCECHDGTRARESDCNHGIFTCGEACALHLGLAGG